MVEIGKREKVTKTPREPSNSSRRTLQGIVECCHRISIQSLELCSKHQKGSASAQGQGFELPRGRRPSLRREAFDFVPDRMAKENNLSISWNAASVRARSPVASKSNCNPRTAANPKVAKACAWSLATATANARATSGSQSLTAPSRNPGNRSRF